MLREKWQERMPRGSAGDIASRFLEQLSDDDLAQLGFESLIGRAQWAQAQIADGQRSSVLIPKLSGMDGGNRIACWPYAFMISHF